MIASVKGLNFSTVFDAAADAMLLAEHTGHIVTANPIAQRLLGYTEAELKGLAIEMLISPRYRKQYRYYQKLFLSKPAKRPMSAGNELVALNREGKELLLDISLTPMEVREKLYTLIIFNVANRRLDTEEALRASEERLRLAKQDAGLGIFAYDFKHNIV